MWPPTDSQLQETNRTLTWLSTKQRIAHEGNTHSFLVLCCSALVSCVHLAIIWTLLAVIMEMWHYFCVPVISQPALTHQKPKNHMEYPQTTSFVLNLIAKSTAARRKSYLRATEVTHGHEHHIYHHPISSQMSYRSSQSPQSSQVQISFFSM